MIVASLLLILVAIVLLVVGVAGTTGGPLVGSILVSLAAAAALLFGVRQDPRSSVVARTAGPRLSAGELARLAGRSDPVVVGDGDERFHLPSCPLPPVAGRREVPVSVAVAAGLLGCPSCGAAAVLLTDQPNR